VTPPDPGELPPLSDAQLDATEQAVSTWLAEERTRNDAVLAIDRGEPGERRWYVRLRGDAKEFTTIWLTLGQRMLHYETYMMPAPEEAHAELYEHLLRRNRSLVGVQFAIGDEDAVYLVGAIPASGVTPAALDRVIGTVVAAVERCFQPALRIGFRSRFADSG
jgi:hypothetical protein